jgi:hypothetical protein
MLFRRSKPAQQWDEEDHRRVRGALAKLDPWSFWSVELDPGIEAEYAVVGTTGAFAVALCGLAGYVEPADDGLRVGEVRMDGFREVKRAAKALHGKLSNAHASTGVEPVICLTRAVAGTSRSVRGVRVVRLDDLPAEIAQRKRALDVGTARKGAQALGHVIPAASGAQPMNQDE